MSWPIFLKRTAARSRRASRAWQVNTPRAQDNLSKLLAALSAIAAPSAGTLTKNVHKFWRVLAAMAERAASNFDRLS